MSENDSFPLGLPTGRSERFQQDQKWYVKHKIEELPRPTTNPHVSVGPNGMWRFFKAGNEMARGARKSDNMLAEVIEKVGKNPHLVRHAVVGDWIHSPQWAKMHKVVGVSAGGTLTLKTGAKAEVSCPNWRAQGLATPSGNITPWTFHDEFKERIRFPIGTRIRLTGPYAGIYQSGDQGTVTVVDGINRNVKMDRNGLAAYFTVGALAERGEIIPPFPVEEDPPRFKVGDKVRVMGWKELKTIRCSDQYVLSGFSGTIARIDHKAAIVKFEKARSNFQYPLDHLIKLD